MIQEGSIVVPVWGRIPYLNSDGKKLFVEISKPAWELAEVKNFAPQDSWNVQCMDENGRSFFTARPFVRLACRADNPLLGSRSPDPILGNCKTPIKTRARLFAQAPLPASKQDPLLGILAPSRPARRLRRLA